VENNAGADGTFPPNSAQSENNGAFILLKSFQRFRIPYLKRNILNNILRGDRSIEFQIIRTG
jgi:hypothetical protein